MTGPQAARRVALQVTADERVQNTRERLAQAYRATVSAKPASMSVIAVCHAAGVARSTFYTHYATIEDLAVSIIAEAFIASAPLDVQRRAAQPSSRAEITRASLNQMITGLDNLRTVVLATVRMASRAAVVERLIAAVAPEIRSAIDADDTGLDDSEAALTAEFVAAGTVHATLQWLEDTDRDRQAIVERLMRLMPAVLTDDASRQGADAYTGAGQVTIQR